MLGLLAFQLTCVLVLFYLVLGCFLDGFSIIFTGLLTLYPGMVSFLPDLLLK